MIVFSHLLNDRSGSPRVLCSAILALTQIDDESRLFVGSHGSGFLDELNIRKSYYWYRRTSYRVITFFTYFISQLCLLIRLFATRNIDKHAVIYVNTLLPFGAALYGRMTGRKVVYHLHEVSVTPAPLRWFLITIARLTAKRLIYVSYFHKQCLPISGIKSYVVHNALDQRFLEHAARNVFRHRIDGRFNVLMLSSLRDYKGVPELVALAQRLTCYEYIHFNLVVNDDELAIKQYFGAVLLPPNLTVHSRTSNPSEYYACTSLVLNLSRPDQWVETFGLTLLEAMSFGVPVIAPPIGGPLELVDDGCEGFLIDCRNGDKIAEAILELADDEALCHRMSAAARCRAFSFSPTAFTEALREVLTFRND